ncbi:MAG: DUF4242 domain-containing protein [Anaerolineales bacterium]|nr:DUF4242 domain-containing protein [Anaerolineales bacterium]
MRRYLAIHSVRNMYPTQEEWVEDWRGLRQRTRQAPGCPIWLASFYAAVDGKLYCEWEAESEEDIRRCFTRRELEMAPFDSIQEIARLDPAWLDE